MRNKMTANQAMLKMVQGYSWISICREMERKGMELQVINRTIEEARKMKELLDI
jgi:hypothetical protein